MPLRYFSLTELDDLGISTEGVVGDAACGQPLDNVWSTLSDHYFSHRAFQSRVGPGVVPKVGWAMGPTSVHWFGFEVEGFRVVASILDFTPNPQTSFYLLGVEDGHVNDPIDWMEDDQLIRLFDALSEDWFGGPLPLFVFESNKGLYARRLQEEVKALDSVIPAAEVFSPRRPHL